uniref:WD-40 repeat-containing protein n=1 Tax=Acetithermum autotrophicum TaxID=1446466 RepID=H5SVU1_ACEAU|nr:WD-40 repeat-containing protein [Candidatus Acetothermum autotrophicum]
MSNGIKLGLISLVVLLMSLPLEVPIKKLEKEGSLTPTPDTLWYKTYLTGKSMALSPDGDLLAAPEGFNGIAVFNRNDGQRVRTLKGHTAPVNTVAFVPNGELLASGSDDKTIRLWRLSDGSEAYRIDAKDRVLLVTFSPKGRRLASIPGGAPSVLIWDVNTRSLERVFSYVPIGAFSQLAFSPDGNFLAFTTLIGTVEIWDVITGSRSYVLQGHRDISTAVAFSPDGTVLASAGFDNTIRLWQWQAEREIQVLHGHEGPVMALAFSPDGKLLASGGGARDNTINVWDAQSGSLLKTLQGHQDSIRTLAFSPDGQYLVSGSRDGSIKVWNVATENAVRSIQGEAFPIYAVVYLPMRKLVAWSGNGPGVHLVWASDGNPVKVLAEEYRFITDLAFSGDGAWLAFTQRFTLSRGDTITLWNVAQNEFTATLRGHRGLVTAISFSADGERLASGSTDGVINLWHREDVSLLWSTQGHTRTVLDVAFSPNQEILASASATEIKLWSLKDGQEIRSFRGSGFVAFSPDGSLLATGGDNPFEVYLWRIMDGTLVRVLSRHSNTVQMGVFSPDGAWLATGSSGGDNTIKIWDVSTGSLLWSWRADESFLNSIAFSDDKGVLFSGGGDGLAAWKLE